MRIDIQEIAATLLLAMSMLEEKEHAVSNESYSYGSIYWNRLMDTTWYCKNSSSAISTMTPLHVAYILLGSLRIPFNQISRVTEEWADQFFTALTTVVNEPPHQFVSVFLGNLRAKRIGFFGLTPEATIVRLRECLAVVNGQSA